MKIREIVDQRAEEERVEEGAYDLALGGGGEGVAALGEDLHHVVGQVAAREVEAEDRVRERVPLVDGHL